MESLIVTTTAELMAIVIGAKEKRNIVIGISAPQETASTNSTSKVSPKPALIKTIEVFTIISVLGLAEYTYSTRVAPFDITAFFTKVVFPEDFKNPNINDWFLSENAEIKNEALFQLVPERNISRWSTWDRHGFYNLTRLQNVDLSADVIKVGGPNSENVNFGLVARLRLNNSSFYYLMINGNGGLIFGKHLGQNWLDEVKDIKNPVVNIGNSSNRLRIVCSNNIITGYINDEIIGSFEDNSNSQGKIGFISSGGDPDGAAVQFDNALVK